MSVDHARAQQVRHALQAQLDRQGVMTTVAPDRYGRVVLAMSPGDAECVALALERDADVWRSRAARI